MSAGTIKFVCARLSNGRHLCKAMETHSGCDINGSTEHRNTEHLMWIGSLTAQVERLHFSHLGMKIMAPLSSV